MGYFRGLTHGAIVGAVVALLYAPESGVKMRRRLAGLLGQAEAMMASDSGATTAVPAAPATRRRPTGGTEARPKRSQP